MARLAVKAQRIHLDRMPPDWLYFERVHLDRASLARLNSAMLVVAIGSGLLACAVGASIFDLGRLFGAWGG